MQFKSRTAEMSREDEEMPSPSHEVDRAIQTQELNRRRLLLGLGAATAMGLIPRSGFAAQTSTPDATPADQARVDQLITLSKTLCGGGNFAATQAATLLSLIDKDAN